MSTPLLSIGMIVKDEIRCIERCFKSLEGLRKELPCEVIVADTGSTDGTREIAEKYADIVFDFEWCNDFAAARNAVLDRCTGKWHLQLDADEWLCDDYQELIQFSHSSKFATHHTAGIRIQNHYSESADRDISEFTTERLFRISSGFRFVGKVHECPRPPKDFTEPYKTTILQKVFLHHDGYISKVRKKKQKNKRNLDILKPMLEAEPESLRILCQCIESTESLQERLEYINRGMDLLYNGKGTALNFAPSLVRHAITFWSISGTVESMEKAWELGQEKYSKSIYISVDGSAAMVLGYYTAKDYEKAAEFGNIWYKNRQEYEKNPNSNLFQILGPLAVKPEDIYTIFFESLCHTQQWERAEEILYEIPVQKLTPKLLFSFIDIFIEYAIHFSDPFKAVHWVIVEQEEYFNKSNQSLLLKQYKSVLLAKVEEHFRKNGALSQTIAQLNNDIGYCARALLQQTDSGMIQYAEQVENWGDVMALLYIRIFERHLLFPDRFYKENAEVWGSVAVALTKLPGLATLFISYQNAVPAITTEQLFWYSSIASALLIEGKWADKEQGIELCRCFAEIEQQLMSRIYTSEMLTQSALHMLPTGHRFGWYLNKVMVEVQHIHLTESIALLREVLQIAPAYKGVIELLLEHISSLNTSPELLILAEKIRGILSQYSPDDPAVQVVKQSPAYQKVAYLIDGSKPPITGSLLQ